MLRTLNSFNFTQTSGNAISLVYMQSLESHTAGMSLCFLDFIRRVDFTALCFFVYLGVFHISALILNI